jgi:hypothetical protein
MPYTRAQLDEKRQRRNPERVASQDIPTTRYEEMQRGLQACETPQRRVGALCPPASDSADPRLRILSMKGEIVDAP